MTYPQALTIARRYNLEQEFIHSYRQFKGIFTYQRTAALLALADWDLL